MRLLHLLPLLPLALLPLAAGCAGDEAETVAVRGEVRGLAFDGAALVVNHEAIPGYMDAMQMTLRADDPAELQGLEAGDLVRFDLVLTGGGAYIENVEPLPPQTPLDLTPPPDEAPPSREELEDAG